MAGGGGGDGKSWIGLLVGGGALVGAAIGAEALGIHLSPWIVGGLLGLGGLLVVFGSCEAMIKAVEGAAARLDMNEFVAGTMAGLASNVPELVMLGFVLAAKPRIGFIVTVLTLHVGAAVFGIYSGLLPRDATGHATLPAPLVKLSTDLYACAAGVFFVTGAIMVLMNVFEAGDHRGEALGAWDLYVLGGFLLVVEVVSVVRLVKRFSGADELPSEERESREKVEAEAPWATKDEPEDEEVEPPPSWTMVGFYGLLGIATSVLGGHAVGDFADILVEGLTAAGYPEMLGAIILSVFAAAGAFVMIISAHLKGMYDIALASASGQVNQVPFVVLPVALILLGVFGQTGVIPPTPHGGVLPIDLETASVVLLAFPSFVILWKAVQDDGAVNWVETTTMIAIFGLAIYFLAVHG
jgi:hypothetical protein